MGTRPRIVIVGAGFGGLWAAQELSSEPVDVLLIDRNNYHNFLPLLYQVAAAEIEPAQIAYPVRAILRKLPNVTFLMDEVVGVDTERQLLHLSEDQLSYDYLILALGSRAHYFGIPGADEHTFALKKMADAIALRNHILRCFETALHETDAEKRKQLLTFTIVGGGPTGVEYAGALSELIRRPLARDYPGVNLDEVSVVLVEGADRLLNAMPPKLSKYTLRRLEKMDVTVMLDAFVSEVTADTVYLQDGRTIATRSTVWTAGVRGETFAEQWSLPTGPGGRVVVQSTLQVEGLDTVFAIGDMMYLEQDGVPLPMLAPVATQQGTHVARNIMLQEQEKSLEGFHYKDRGSMATIGRNAAVVQLGKRTFSGYFAWLMWLFVHLTNLIGFRNRIIVLINWAWNYLFYERVGRFIFHADEDIQEGR
jgi:NADH dehydrogenase